VRLFVVLIKITLNQSILEIKILLTMIPLYRLVNMDKNKFNSQIYKIRTKIKNIIFYLIKNILISNNKINFKKFLNILPLIYILVGNFNYFMWLDFFRIFNMFLRTFLKFENR
jgi:hypothetical protein